MFIGRNADGTIYGLWTVRQWDGQEELADGSPEIIAFLKPVVIIDGSGFAQAIKAGVGGIVAANALAIVYPLFFSAVELANWPDVQALILDAQTKSVLNQTQYAAFKTAAAAFNIPIELP